MDTKGLQQQRWRTAFLLTTTVAIAILYACWGGGTAEAGSASPKSPVVNLSPGSVSFGSQPLKSPSGAKTVTLTNTGKTPLNISSLTLKGANAGDFARTNTCGSSLGAGAKCTLSVTFMPSASGSRTATLSISDNATGSPQTVSLSGTGVAAVASISPSSVTFGTEPVDATSSPQVITLNNTGGAALNITSIAATGTDANDFTAVNTCSPSLAAGGQCTIAIIFTPAAAGTRVASLSISGNASNGPQSVSLSGTGMQAVSTGTTYYVDDCVVIGSDSNNGTSAATPWLTVHKVNMSTFNPGDSILFESTCTWREGLVVPSSGSAASPITFGAYGTGAQPVFNAANLLTSWVSELPLYYASATAQPDQVFRDNRRLTLSASKAALATGQWWWDSVNLRVYVYDNPSGNTIEETPPGTTGFANYGHSYNSVNNLRVTKSERGFWFFGGSTYNTCTGCAADWNYMSGLNITDAGTAHVQILNAVSHDNLGHGVTTSGADNVLISGGSTYNNPTTYAAGVDLESTNSSVENVNSYSNFYGIKAYGANSPVTNAYIGMNTTYGNTLDGIDVDTTEGATGIIVEKNSSYLNGGQNINIEVGSSSVVARYNLVHDAGNDAENFYGIYVNSSPNVSVYGNIAYNNDVNYYANYASTGVCFYNNVSFGGRFGFQANNGSTGITIKNNVAVSSSLALVYIDSTSQAGFTANYNDWYAAGSSGLLWWYASGETFKSYSFSAWQTITAQDTSSINADPEFVNASAAQFWLASTSPAIGTGTNLGSPYNIGLLPGSSWPNSILTEDQNGSGTGWEIGAYIYTGQ